MCEEVTIHPFCLDRGCKIYNAVIGLQNRKHSSISTDGWWLLQSLCLIGLRTGSSSFCLSNLPSYKQDSAWFPVTDSPVCQTLFSRAESNCVFWTCCSSLNHLPESFCLSGLSWLLVSPLCVFDMRITARSWTMLRPLTLLNGLCGFWLLDPLNTAGSDGFLNIQGYWDVESERIVCV